MFTPLKFKIHLENLIITVIFMVVPLIKAFKIWLQVGYHAMDTPRLSCHYLSQLVDVLPKFLFREGKETSCVTILQNTTSKAIYCSFENCDHVRLLVKKCPFSAKQSFHLLHLVPVSLNNLTPIMILAQSIFHFFDVRICRNNLLYDDGFIRILRLVYLLGMIVVTQYRQLDMGSNLEDTVFFIAMCFTRTVWLD